MIYGFTLGSACETILQGQADKGLALFTQVKQLGCTTVRMDAWYTTSFPVSNDAVIKAAVNAGLDVLIIFNGYNASTITAAQFATFAAAVTTTYSALGLHHYEVINEPGNPANWNPTAQTTNPGLYTALLKLVYPAVHTADPAAVVLLGSLFVYGAYIAPTGTWNGTAWTGGTPPGQYGTSAGAYSTVTGDYGGGVNPIAWLQTLYAAGAHGYFDAVGVHPYCYPALPNGTQSYSGWYQMFGTSPSIYSLMQANGDTNTPMWITEYGWLSDNSVSAGWPNVVNTLAGQAQSHSLALQQAALHSQLKMFLFFNIFDDGDGQWGAFDSLGAPKPALAQMLSGMGQPVARFTGAPGVRSRYAAVALTEI